MKKNKLLALIAFFLFGSLSMFAVPKTASEYFDLGLEAQNNENWFTASENFMQAIKENPAYADAWFHLAQCSYQLSEFELCLIQLDEAEKYSKDDNSIQNLRGMTFIAIEKFDDARKIFENILKKFPNNIDARFGLAELDLFDGKLTGAQKQYNEALKRHGQNRKALLSLAILSAQLGKFNQAEDYMKRALEYYSDEAEVHYLSAVVYCMKGDILTAEKKCRIALELNGSYDKAYDLLAKILFFKGEYADSINICDYRIGRDRNLTSAWYLKGACQSEMENPFDAIQTWSNALQIVNDDEVMRAVLEINVNNYVPLEDSRRVGWAQYHIEKARECMRRFDRVGAIYEYQRALKIHPSNKEARLNYAEMLELNGMHELYLEQLLFARENSISKNDDEKKNLDEIMMNDKIEAYNNLLQDSLSKKWNVDPFYLDKTRWNLGIYYVPSDVNQKHLRNNKIAAEFAKDIFTGILTQSVRPVVMSVSGFGDAYKKARSSAMDYFIIINFDEGERDVTLDFTLYSARTGFKIAEKSLYGTANSRYASVFRRLRSEVLSYLPIRAKIINREGRTLLADIGISENINNGAIFDVVRKNSIQTSSSSGGVSYRDDDILGTFTVTTVSEEVCEGILENKGFYDRVNIGDELVLLALGKFAEDEENRNADDSAIENLVGTNQNAPSADVNGQNLLEKIKARNENTNLTAKELGIRRMPSFIDLIRSIY